MIDQKPHYEVGDLVCVLKGSVNSNQYINGIVIYSDKSIIDVRLMIDGWDVTRTFFHKDVFYLNKYKSSIVV